MVLVFNKSGNFKDPFQDVDDLVLQENTSSTCEYEEKDSIAGTLEQEFSENKITADKYIMQLAYSIYDTDSLDYKYKDLEAGTKTPTVSAKSLKLNTLESVVKKQSSFMCPQIEENEDWYNIYYEN